MAKIYPAKIPTPKKAAAASGMATKPGFMPGRGKPSGLKLTAGASSGNPMPAFKGGGLVPPPTKVIKNR